MCIRIMYIRTYIHMYSCMHVYTCTCMCLELYMYRYILYTCTCTCTCIFRHGMRSTCNVQCHTCTCIRKCNVQCHTCTCIRKCTLTCVYMYICMHIHNNIHVLIASPSHVHCTCIYAVYSLGGSSSAADITTSPC